MICKRIYEHLFTMDIGDNDISEGVSHTESKNMCIMSVCLDFNDL